MGEIPERLESGHRGCASSWGGGGYWRLEMRLGLALGDGNGFGGESGPDWGAGGVTPLPPLKRFPAGEGGAGGGGVCRISGKSESTNSGGTNPAPFLRDERTHRAALAKMAHEKQWTAAVVSCRTVRVHRPALVSAPPRMPQEHCT